MLRYVLLGSAIAIATPVIAQDSMMSTPTRPVAAQTDPMPADASVTTETGAAKKAEKKAKKDRKAAEMATTESTAVETAAAPADAAADPMTATASPAAAPASQPAPEQSAQADPAPVTPAAPGTPAQTAAAPSAPAQQPAQAAQAQPTSGDQVASIVETEFGSYDKDKNGTLDKIEFAAWMDALKAKAPDSAGKPGDPKWNEAAFAQADADKSTTVTKQELTGFLGGASRAGAM